MAVTSSRVNIGYGICPRCGSKKLQLVKEYEIDGNWYVDGSVIETDEHEEYSSRDENPSNNGEAYWVAECSRCGYLSL